MSTHDVPGANPANHDELAMGCWAEHEDGSLILVESTEGNRVIYSIFDLSQRDPIEYRHALPEAAFKDTFTWVKGGSGKKTNEKWVWHDKTPFPWDKIIKAGISEGQRPVSADDFLTAAQRVAEHLKLTGASVSRDINHRSDQPGQKDTGRVIMDKIGRALNELLK